MNILKKVRYLGVSLFGLPDTFTEAAWMHKKGRTESKEIINDILYLEAMYINEVDGSKTIYDDDIIDYIFDQSENNDILTSIEELKELGQENIEDILGLNFEYLDMHGLVGKPK